MPVPLQQESIPASQLAGAHIGIAMFEARITTDGAVADVRVIQGMSPAVDAAAIETIRKWRYLPARHKGQPVPVELVITLHLCG